MSKKLNGVNTTETNNMIETLSRYADVVLSFRNSGDNPEVEKCPIGLEDLDTEVILVYVENLPLKQQPDRLFIETIQTLWRNTKRVKYNLGLHIYPNLTALEG